MKYFLFITMLSLMSIKSALCFTTSEKVFEWMAKPEKSFEKYLVQTY